MGVFFALLLKFFNQYEESDDPVVFVKAETIVLNDEVKKDRVICVKPGKKPYTYHILISDGNELTLDIHN